MPWPEITVMSSRTEFVALAQTPGVNRRELCRRFGISPKTGYKLLARYREQGEAGLADRSRRPQHSPRRSSQEMEQRVLALREQYPYWGGRKLRALLLREGIDPPSASTLTEILRRHGRLETQEAADRPATGRFEHPAPNLLWQMDFKGHFALLNRQRCHPLTLLDDHSRFALCLQACGNERTGTVQQALCEVFRRYGLPLAITADNGPPWGSTGSRTLTALEAWLIRLGVRVRHSRPYHPQTQGKDERLHRTLNRELLARRGFADLTDCQRQFDRWRHRYNQLRPHEALDMQSPISRYQPSPRRFPERLPAVEYDIGDLVRLVNQKGMFSFRGRRYFAGEGVAGQPVALRAQGEDGVWQVYFCHHLLTQIDEREQD